MWHEIKTWSYLKLLASTNHAKCPIFEKYKICLNPTKLLPIVISNNNEDLAVERRSVI